MSGFEEWAMLLIVVWLAIVMLGRWRRSAAPIVIGLAAVGVFVGVELFRGAVTPNQLGLTSRTWTFTIGWSFPWLGLMLAFSPVADRIASRFVAEPPNLGVFRALCKSPAHLAAGVAAAWLLGAFLEELVARGIVLQSVEGLTASWLPRAAASAAGLIAAAAEPASCTCIKAEELC